jgi:5-methylcytosine-specific restriction enzyme A
VRNPKWHRDEVLLALDLYFKLRPGQISATNPDIIDLSDLLNKLPIHEVRPDSIKFRNANGVGLKLSNFLAIDPNYNGKGMESYSKLDEEIFYEFNNDRENLKRIAETIKSLVNNDSINKELFKFRGIDDDQETSVKEGKVLFRYHKLRERNTTLVQRKKSIQLERFSKLECEVCGFDFFDTYGKLGHGFIECHHRIPLATANTESETKLEDLALVCSNCHRMLHRVIGTISILDLKNIITTQMSLTE